MNVYTLVIKYTHHFIFSIQKYKVTFLLSILLGFAPFIFSYLNSKNTYESSFTVAYDDLVRKIYGDRLVKINSLVHQKDYKKAAACLGVSEEDAKALVAVAGKNILGEDLSKDMNTDKIPFIVKMTIKDSSKTTILQKGIVNFLETGTVYMTNKTKIKQKEISDEIAYIDHQLNVMDSLKKHYLAEQVSINPREQNSNTPAYNSVFQFSYELYKKKQDLLRKKEMPETLQVVDDAIVSKTKSRSLLTMLIYGTALSFIIYTIAIVFVIPVLTYKEEIN